MKRLKYGLALLTGCIALPAWADLLQDGVKAYINKDYATALHDFSPLAGKGDARAQFWLGVMYDQGKGVPQDAREAEKWFRLAANQGDADAQYNLGGMYAKGQGVPQDNVMAYALYNLASSSTQQAATNRQSLVTQMTRAQIENGQELTRQMLRPGNFTKAYQARLETIARPQR